MSLTLGFACPRLRLLFRVFTAVTCNAFSSQRQHRSSGAAAMGLVEAHGVPLKDSWNGEPLTDERITGDEALSILA